jgi:hypothetical protein
MTRRDSCWNTLEIAMRSSKRQVSYTHAQVFDYTKASLDLNLNGGATSEFNRTLQTLAETRVTDDGAEEFFRKLYFNKTMIDELSTSQANKIQALMFIYANEPTQDNIRGTLWGVVNAVTFNQDHATRARSDDNRLTSAWFGTGRTIKNQALEMAIEQAEATQL